MQKSKRKGRPRKYRYILAGVALILLSAVSYCGWFAVNGRSLSYFSRFEAEPEVEDFLYQHLQPNISTKDNILIFMANYPVDGECRESIPTASVREQEAIPDEVDTLIFCRVPFMATIAGTAYYDLLFYFSADDRLVYTDVKYFCMCL